MFTKQNQACKCPNSLICINTSPCSPWTTEYNCFLPVYMLVSIAVGSVTKPYIGCVNLIKVYVLKQCMSSAHRIQQILYHNFSKVLILLLALQSNERDFISTGKKKKSLLLLWNYCTIENNSCNSFSSVLKLNVPLCDSVFAFFSSLLIDFASADIIHLAF